MDVTETNGLGGEPIEPLFQRGDIWFPGGVLRRSDCDDPLVVVNHLAEVKADD